MTHAADDVFHAGALRAKVLVRHPVQVEGGEGLRGSVGVEARRRRWSPEGGGRGGGRWRGERRPGGEAVGRAVTVGVAAGVLCMDL